MEQVLMREAAPLSEAQWALVDETVRRVASRVLVGRRFLSLYGPLGFGTYIVPLYTYAVQEAEPVRAKITRQLPLATVEQDFAISVRDLEAFNAGQPFDVAPVAAAASLCAAAEDRLIFHGDPAAGLEGLLTATGRQTAPLGDWATEGRAMADVAAAVALLVSAGFYGPYTVVVSPRRFAQLQHIEGRSGVMAAELVEKLAGALYLSPAVPDGQALVIAPQAQHVDLAVGQDMVTAYLETASMEHRFRVMETLALRIKQPAAICMLE